MTAECLIRIKNLEIERGTKFRLTVKDWTLLPGEVVGIVGPNGAGKTTLLETLAGIRKSAKDSVAVFGQHPWRSPEIVRSQLGFMCDDLPLFDLRIGPLLRMLSGYYPTWNKNLVNDLLKRFKLDPSARVDKLSKGEGTRIRLVTAMAFEPRVLILDEPATGLDLGGRRELLKSVLEVVKDPQRSVIFSSHMLQDVERIADRLLVLSDGKVVKQGATDSLIGDHQTLEEALLDWGAAG
jgi:ABC-2 type transport system ATP-binding protein